MQSLTFKEILGTAVAKDGAGVRTIADPQEIESGWNDAAAGFRTPLPVGNPIPTILSVQSVQHRFAACLT